MLLNAGHVFDFLVGILNLYNYLNINLETVMFQHLSCSLRRQFDVNHLERHRRTFVCRFVAADHHIITFGIIWECANFTRRCLMDFDGEQAWLAQNYPMRKSIQFVDHAVAFQFMSIKSQ